MKLRFVWLIVLVCILILPLQTFCGWQKQNSGSLAWLHSVYFVDSQNGFAVGANGAILNTNDAGATWRKTNAESKDNLRDIIFTNQKNGWILAERNQYTLKKNEPGSYLLQTIDAGKTWRTIEFPNNDSNSQFVRFVLSVDKQKLWAIGSGGALYSLVSDMGGRWQKQTPPTDYLLLGGWFLDARQGWLTSAGGSVLKTVDGGALWRETAVSPNDKVRLNAAFFISPHQGWLVGARGRIWATANGVKWLAQNSQTDADLLDVQFITVSEGWAAGEAGVLLYTADGGATWTLEEVARKTNRRLERLFFAETADKQTRGWAVGFGGTILAYSK